MEINEKNKLTKIEKEEIYYDILQTKFCEIILVGNENGLQNLHLNTNKGTRKPLIIQNEWILDSKIFKNVKQQIIEYFEKKRKKFNIKLNPNGTQFQKKVWNELSKISHGEILTYKQIAKKIGNENASRAVGMANGKNPIPIIIPCHRVIGTNGKLTGFAFGLEIKEKLLEIEN